MLEVGQTKVNWDQKHKPGREPSKDHSHNVTHP